MLLEIVTPEKTLYKDEIDEIIVPTATGELAVLPEHVGLLTKIIAGEIKIKKNNKTESVAVTGGFMEINKDHINILADYAIKTDDIELAKVEKAKEQAEKLMKEKTTEKDFRIAEVELVKAITQLKVAEKYRKRR